MNHARYLVPRVLLIASFFALPGFLGATEVPMKKPEPSGTSLARPTVPAPKAESAESKPKPAERLKWDQLDPKAIERSTKKAQGKSPFGAVPAGR